ncbi:MAG: coproporphyrinogen III oxidase, partial [Rhodobacteraceae bacterium]|nr:coproporphyrinogen III oxidase [Paracoccaceae bacterium]
GRLHSAAEGRAAFALARGLFPRTSLDLIYARQRQTPAAWREDLGEALALEPDHLSLYQLTIEEGTPFAVRARAGRLPGLPDEDRAVALYDLTQELCEAAGRPAYEVSNHARPGGECRHNLIYWRSGDFAGIGPGAHGRLTLAGCRLATEAHRNPRAWLEAVEAQGSGESRRAALTLAEVGEEYALMGLRLPEGIALDRLAAAGIVPDPARRGVLADLGLIDIAAGRLRVTRSGRLVLDRILGELLAR